MSMPGSDGLAFMMQGPRRAPATPSATKREWGDGIQRSRIRTGAGSGRQAAVSAALRDRADHPIRDGSALLPGIVCKMCLCLNRVVGRVQQPPAEARAVRLEHQGVHRGLGHLEDADAQRARDEHFGGAVVVVFSGWAELVVGGVEQLPAESRAVRGRKGGHRPALLREVPLPCGLEMTTSSRSMSPLRCSKRL